jgi:putative transposase
MPHALRIQEPNLLFHVLNRGNEKHEVFRSIADFNYAKSLIQKYKPPFAISLYFYVLMPNHVHFILETAKSKGISGFMHDFSLAYAHYYRKMYEGVGHVWQSRYKAKFLEKDSYLLQCGQYIEENPVRAGLVEKPEDYPWSSCRAHKFGIFDPILDPCPYIVSNQVPIAKSAHE